MTIPHKPVSGWRIEEQPRPGDRRLAAVNFYGVTVRRFHTLAAAQAWWSR